MATSETAAPLPVLRTNVAGIVPGLVERGKIKVGEKGAMTTSQRGTKYQPPKKLDHFRVTTLEKGPDDNFLTDEAIHKMLGGPTPTEIPIVLMFDEIDRNFSTRFVYFTGKTRWCSGDGEHAIRLTDDKGNMASVQCPCERLNQDYKGDTRCRIAGVLSVVIRGAETVGGVWKFRTTSWNSCQSILSSLTLIKGITSGRLAGVPLMLTLSPKTGTTPKGESVKIYIVSIEYKGTPEELMEVGYQKMLTNATYNKRMELVSAEAARLLAAELPAAEDAEFAEEFVPEQAQAASGVQLQPEGATAQTTATQTPPPKQTRTRGARTPQPAQTGEDATPAPPPSGAEAFGITDPDGEPDADNGDDDPGDEDTTTTDEDTEYDGDIF